MNINLNQLYIFYVISEEGSIGKAAKKLCVTAPAVSMQLKKLEECLNFSLFIRLSNSLELTEEAKEILPIAREMFLQANIINNKIERMQKSKNNSLIIGTQLSLAHEIIPVFLRYTNSILPLIDIKIIVGTREENIQNLKEEKVDIVLLANTLEDKSLLFQDFIQEEIVYVVSKQNTIFKNRIINISELNSIPTIMPPVNSGFSQHLLSFLNEHKIKLNIAMKDIAPSVTKNLIPESNYGAFLNKLFIQKELNEKTFRIIETKEKIPPIHFYFASLIKNRENPALKNFLEAVKNTQSFSNFLHTEKESLDDKHA